MYSSFFIHSSVDGHLGCFHVLALLNSAVVNIRIHVSFSNRVSPVIFNLSYSICHCWLFFNSSRSLLNISCIFSICVSSLSMPPFYFQKFGSSLLLFFWIIFLVDFLFTVPLFNPVGFNHVPSSSGCFSVTSFRLICCVWAQPLPFRMTRSSSTHQNTNTNPPNQKTFRSHWSNPTQGRQTP